MGFARIPYLFLRDGIFWFRMPIPGHLTERLKSREIKGSLFTRDKIKAKRRCRALSSAFEGLLGTASEMPELDHATIKTLIRSYFQTLLNKAEEIAQLAPEDEKFDVDWEIQSMKGEQQKLTSQLQTRKFDDTTISEARKILDQVGYNQPSSLDDQFHQLCLAVVRARQENQRILIAKLLGNFAAIAPEDSLFSDMAFNGLPAMPGAKGAIPGTKSIDDLIAAYIALKEKADWVSKTKNENVRSLGLFGEITGAKRPINTLKTEDISNFRNTLMELPSNYVKNKAWAGKPLSFILAAGKDHAKLAAKTRSKYFSNMRGFLGWCIAEDHLQAMPGSKISMWSSAGKAKDAKKPFSHSDLQAFFSSPLYVGYASPSRRHKPGTILTRDGKYWIPLIGLFSGMRLGEIAQLLISDVKTSESIWFFDISKEGDDGKQIKTASSYRRVPIHPKLIELGLLAYIEARRKQSGHDSAARIFSEISPGADGYHSHNFSKWFSRYLTLVELKGKKTSFHSFRHNFKDGLSAAKIDPELRMALMGHAEDSVHGNYGSNPTLQMLKDAISLLSYPIDLSHLVPTNGK